MQIVIVTCIKPRKKNGDTDVTQRRSSDSEELDNRLFFEHFYEQHKQFLYYIIRRRCHNEDDVQEVVQESWVRLLKHISALREINECKVPKYIALTVRAVYIDLEKKKHSARTVSLDEFLLETFHGGVTQTETDMEEIDRRTKIHKLKESLSTRDWFVLEGKYILGYSDAELAEQLSVAPDSIRMILTRAKRNARNIIDGL